MVNVCYIFILIVNTVAKYQVFKSFIFRSGTRIIKGDMYYFNVLL